MTATSAFAQGALPAGIPDLCATPTISSAKSGNWSDPSTWSSSRVPVAGDLVRIDATDTVTYDVVSDAALDCISVYGGLSFATGASTRLVVGTLTVIEGGTLTIGTATAPVAAGVTAELVVANRPLNTTTDPQQFGTGVLALGTVTMYGLEKTPTWVRLALEPLAGDTTLTLDQPVSNWRVGDRLILPDTRHLRWDEVASWTRTTAQWEELSLAAISADGRVLTITSALRFNHFGARDGLAGAGTLRLLPHVGNLTRNVIVRSQAPIGSGGVQGHVYVSNRATADIRYAAFRDLGRTQTGAGTANGRYPVYFDDLTGPVTTPANGYQFTFIGNAVDGGSTSHKKRWAVTLGNAHYGLISDNVLYNYAGSLLATEDGSESYNVIEHNFAMRSSGTGGRLGNGDEGQGFWFRGPNNYVRGNVAVDFDSDAAEAAYGYKYFMRLLGTVQIPTAKGQASSAYVPVDGNNLPILEFSDNEVYSSAQGVTYWWLSSQDPVAPPDARESVFLNTRIWHVYNIGVYHYPAARVRFDGLTILGQDPANSACCGRGVHGEDYAATDIRIVNADIEGMAVGVNPSAAGTGLQVVENSTLRNQTDLHIKTMYSSNGPGWLPPRKVIAANVTFQGTTTISMDWSVDAQSNTVQTDQLLVYDYQAVGSDDFQVYYNQQASQNVAGGIAPCGNHRAEINGIVCSTAASTGPALTWLNPFQGTTAGGTATTLYGANFVSGASVSFGGTSATNMIVSANSITATAPSHAAGNVAVTVTNPNAQAATFSNGFRFVTGPGCSYGASPTSQAMTADGGTGSVTVTADSGCTWSTTSQAAWISIATGASGSGNGSVTYTVAANSGATRTGTLTVAGQPVTVTQQGQACSVTVSPTAASPAAAGEALSVSVTAPVGCNWTTTDNVTWISVTAGSTGSGNGTVSYTVDPNSSTTARTGMLTIGIQTVTVTQAGQTCNYTVSPTAASAAAAGGPLSASVTAASGCTWTAASNVSWIGVTSSSTGNGNGTVSYTVDPNTSATARTGTLTVAALTVTVTQAGQPAQQVCPCTIWSAATTPAVITGDAHAVEVGVRFRTDVNGTIAGVRFYKGAANTGTHVGNLWSNTGALLATAIFTGESASGWQQVIFSAPVAVAANTTYIASYHTNTGNYALNAAYFAAAGVDNAPLHALANTVAANGVFVYGASAFPSQTYNSSNYWVDVVFNPTATDTTPPTVSMTAPANGATVSGSSVTVAATAADNVGVVGVQFKLDGANLGAEMTAAPYAVSWNTSTTTNAAHSLTAVARDAAGNSATATAVSVTVNNADTMAPTVSMTAPVNGTAVSGTAVTVSATAADNIGVVGVQFLLDGLPLGAEETTGPYTMVWNTMSIADGLHSLAARARDAAGNQATSAAVSVTVSNTVSPPVIDAVTSGDQPGPLLTVTTTAFSTTAGNELLLAFVSTDGSTNTIVASVTGGGLTWQLVRRTNVQLGTSEIWSAFAATPLSNAAVTATLSQSAASSLIVVSFTGVDTSLGNGAGAIGATGSNNAAAGAPSATLTTTRNNSWVFGVGNDWDTATPRTLGPNQTMVHQYMPPVGDTYWVQRTTSPTALAGTIVTINDVAPSGDRYNLTICEILAQK